MALLTVYKNRTNRVPPEQHDNLVSEKLVPNE